MLEDLSSVKVCGRKTDKPAGETTKISRKMKNEKINKRTKIKGLPMNTGDVVRLERAMKRGEAV